MDENLNRRFYGFTLAELLIALAILGVIATFTIPKIIVAQQNEQRKAIAKEAAGTLSGAFTSYKLASGITAGVSLDKDLFQYINYVKLDTSSTLDERPGATGPTYCSVTDPCVRLHNGALIKSWGGAWYNTNTTDAIYFHVDPDGAYTGKDDSVVFAIYTNGLVRTRGTILANTEFPGGAIRNPDATADPGWFSW